MQRTALVIVVVVALSLLGMISTSTARGADIRCSYRSGTLANVDFTAYRYVYKSVWHSPDGPGSWQDEYWGWRTSAGNRWTYSVLWSGVWVFMNVDFIAQWPYNVYRATWISNNTWNPYYPYAYWMSQANAGYGGGPHTCTG
jgi:hypothetical protein